MPEQPGELAFLIGLLLYYALIYGRHMRRFRRSRATAARTRPVDAALDFLTFIAWQVLPLIVIFTSRLADYDYSLPGWAVALGSLLFAGSLTWLRWAYGSLGRNWSPKLDILEHHALVTEGAYARIRHPIYAGFWLWTIAQPLLVQNWIGGWSMMAAFALLYAVRVPREERMMLEAFGDEYRIYTERTGRVFPRLRR